MIRTNVPDGDGGSSEVKTKVGLPDDRYIPFGATGCHNKQIWLKRKSDGRYYRMHKARALDMSEPVASGSGSSLETKGFLPPYQPYDPATGMVCSPLQKAGHGSRLYQELAGSNVTALQDIPTSKPLSDPEYEAEYEVSHLFLACC
jgi:hypothetical protein